MPKFIATFAVLLTTSLASAGDRWPQFRGPTGDGLSDAVGLPVIWSETENVTWKTPIHGRAWSSPVVLGNQIWMTTAPEDGHEMSVICVALDSGRIVHDIRLFTDIVVVQEMIALNSFASPTPVIEEGRVWVHFGVYGTACLDTSTGKVLWMRRDIHCDHYRGPGSSPILYGDLLIFHMDGIDVQYVIALDKATGATRWKTDRSIDLEAYVPDLRKAYSTPLLIEVDGRTQMLSTGSEGSYSYDPATGKELWRVRHNGFSNVSRPLFGRGVAYLNTGFSKAHLWAVRCDGGGDVTDTHVEWTLTKAVPSKPTPVLVDGLLFMADDNGVASCVEAATGEVVWQERIGGKHSASPIHAEGRVYFFSHEGETTVVQATRQF
ncbi:MAG: PQQ-binding-like beta-propeller repeat protein, partial [Thermoguttaceae bacterium]